MMQALCVASNLGADSAGGIAIIARATYAADGEIVQFLHL